MSATVDLRRRYAASAEHFRHRPSYPPELLDWIISVTGRRPPARAADVGCGSGIATRLFAARGFETVGIDHNHEMLACALRDSAGRYVRADAVATGLADHCLDLVIAAQSFHWFELLPTLAEFRRILRADGWCAAFWNLRASTPLFDEYDELLRRSSSEYAVMLKQEASPGALRSAPGVTQVWETEFRNSQLLDLEGLRGRAYSSSCVAHGVADPRAFDAALYALFRRHQRGGRVELHYRTVAVCWQLVEAR